MMKNDEIVWEHREMETLLILQEECSEVAQAISKCFRFGKDGEWEGTTNKQRMENNRFFLLWVISMTI